jgi:hypothetical protein
LGIGLGDEKSPASGYEGGWFGFEEFCVRLGFLMKKGAVATAPFYAKGSMA